MLKVTIPVAVNKQIHIAQLQMVIQRVHHCEAVHRETVPAHKAFEGKTVWQGDVEVFELTGHPKATRCYGWSYGEPEEFITILELPPATDVQSAVKVGVAYQIRKARGK